MKKAINNILTHINPTWILAAFYLFILTVLTFCTGCTHTKTITVPVPEYHTVTTHDTLIQRDTITNNHTTIIRELDSTQMAQYGIQLATQQRAWLIERNTMRQQIKDLQHITRDTIRDSIPYPIEVPIIQQVPTPIPWYQQTFLYIGYVSTALLLLTLLYIYTKR